MDLIICNNNISVWTYSEGNDLKEKFKNNTFTKFVAINHLDGESIGIIDKSSELRILSLEGHIKYTSPIKSNMTSFLFYNNTTLVAGDILGRLYRLDISKTNTIKSTLITTQIINDSIKSIHASPEHRLLYCCHKSGIISHYNTKKKETRILKSNESVSILNTGCWSDREILAGCNSGVVQRYDCERDLLLNQWKHHRLSVTGVAFSMYNQHVALSISTDRTAALLACDTSSVIKSFNLRNNPTACAFNQEKLFAIGDEAGIISIFDIRMNKLMKDFKVGGKINFVEFNHRDKNSEQIDTFSSTRIAEGSQPNMTNSNNNNNYSSSGNSLFSADGSVYEEKITNIDKEIDRRLLKEVQNTTNNYNSSGNSVYSAERYIYEEKINNIDKKTEKIDKSSNQRCLKETQNTTNNYTSSGKSLFSADGSVYEEKVNNTDKETPKIDKSSNQRFLKEAQNTTNDCISSRNSLFSIDDCIYEEKINNVDKKNPKIDKSSNQRYLKEVQNTTNNFSSAGNSLFSVDGSVDSRHTSGNSFDLSESSAFNYVDRSIYENKKRKQVQFKGVNGSPIINTKIDSLIPLSLTPVSKNIRLTETIVPDNNMALKSVIVEELRKELVNTELRIKNDIMSEMIDQLYITENNIIGPLKTLVEEKQWLIEENEMLRQELRKYKYNI